MTELHDWDALVKLVLSEAKTLISAKQAYLVLFKDDGLLTEPACFDALGSKLAGPVAEAFLVACGKISSQHEVVFLRDPVAIPAGLRLIAGQTCYLPLRTPVGLRGGIVFGELRARLNAGKIELLLNLGQHAAACLENILLRRRWEAQTNYLLDYDDLVTKLPNHRAFKRELAESLSRTRERGLLAVFLIDLDNLSQVNRNLGHQMGDFFLFLLSQRMAEFAQTRKIGSLPARIGGDEFALLVEGIASPQAAWFLATEMLADFRSPLSFNGGSYRATASIGIGLYPHDARTAETLLHCAGQAMYAAKDQGKDRCSFYSLSNRATKPAQLDVPLDNKRRLTNMSKRPQNKFFICYRRNDNLDFVEHIHSWFAWQYGNDNVFMDSVSFRGAEDWQEEIPKEIEKCDVLLAIIGPKWKHLLKEAATQETDWVRKEIELASNKGKIIIPVSIKQTAERAVAMIPPHLQPSILKQHVIELPANDDLRKKIEGAMNIIDGLLKDKGTRIQQLDRLGEVSPAPGLALAYYANFLKPAVDVLLAINVGSNIKARLSEQKAEIEIEIEQPAKLQVVIPPKIEYAKPEELIKETQELLTQITIQSPNTPRRSFLYANKAGQAYQPIDFPTIITAFEPWLEGLFRKNGSKTTADEVEKQKKEMEALRGFKESLELWIDELSGPDFRNCIDIQIFDPAKPQSGWLSKLWSSRSSKPDD